MPPKWLVVLQHLYLSNASIVSSWIYSEAEACQAGETGRVGANEEVDSHLVRVAVGQPQFNQRSRESRIPRHCDVDLATQMLSFLHCAAPHTGHHHSLLDDLGDLVQRPPEHLIRIVLPAEDAKSFHRGNKSGNALDCE